MRKTVVTPVTPSVRRVAWVVAMAGLMFVLALSGIVDFHFPYDRPVA